MWHIAVVDIRRQRQQRKTMGLSGGEHGVKAQIKKRFPSSFSEFESLQSAREATGFRVDQTVVILDGNVLSNQIPIAVNDVDGYVRILSGFVNKAFCAGDIVVVVFDEAAHMTLAKKAEQDRRDAARRKNIIKTSSDLESFLGPKDDNFTLDDVESCDPHSVLKHRGTRGRLYDFLWMRVKRAVETAGKTFVLDGIDASGIDRPSGTKRDASIVSSDARLEAVLSHPRPIGEGDLKLTDIACVVQEKRDAGFEPFKNIEMIVISTIDTDSLAIELINEAAKDAERRLNGCSDMRLLLAFKEFSGKRGSDDFKTSFACFDMQLLLDNVLTFMFGDEKTSSVHLHRNAIALLGIAWTLCGCDFVDVKGMRSDVATDVVAALCKTDVALLLPLTAIWDCKRDDTQRIQTLRRDVNYAIDRLVTESARVLGSMPRMARSCASLKTDYSNTDASKACWVALYWHGLELGDVASWGF